MTRDPHRARVAAGHMRAQAAGKAYSGEPPFGWRNVKGKLVRCDHEQATMARILELRAAGTPMRRIALVLTSEGRQPRGKAWHLTTVARLIRAHEPLYTQVTEGAPF